MTKGGSTTWRRWLAVNLAWALGLLLLTNIGWSVWFAWAANEGRYRGTELNLPGQSRGILKKGKGSYLHVRRTDYGPCTSIHVVPQSVSHHIEAAWEEEYSGHYFGDWSALGIDEVAPPWLWDEEREEFCPTVQTLIVCELDWPTISLVGWPTALLWCAESQEPSRMASGDYTSRVVGGTGLQLTPGRNPPALSAASPDEPGVMYGRVLPLRPIWTGQAVYAVFWFLLVYPLWRMASVARGTWRSRRGRCANCAYDLRANTSGVCPECGVEFDGVTA